MRFLVGYIFKIKENWSRSYKIDSTINSKLRFFFQNSTLPGTKPQEPPNPPQKYCRLPPHPQKKNKKKNMVKGAGIP